jgi:pilus assembly protein TadC
MTIQLNAGVPLFETLVIVSNQDFGEVSKEFKTVTRAINAGVPQIKALEELAIRNPSPYFRRTIWQLINGMKEGADINKILRSIIRNLTKEQVIQIEKYGSQLNPLVTFYMMGAIIFPALAITFLIAIIAFLGLDKTATQFIFWSLVAFVIFFQVMFANTIKSKRPSLLGE